MAVEIEGTVYLGGFQMALNLDAAVIRVDDVTLYDSLGSTGRSVVPLGPEIDNDTGTVTFGGFSFGDQPGTSADGTLAMATLTAQEAASSSLTLENVQIVDTDGQTQTVVVEDGSMAVGTARRLYLPLIGGQ